MKKCDGRKGYVPNDEDFINFSRQLLFSGDIDPVYPVLKEYFRLRDFSMEEKLFGVHVYLTYYNTYWTIVTLELLRDNLCWEAILDTEFVRNKLVKFGSDRRGIRALGLDKVLPKFIEFFQGTTMEKYYLSGLTGEPRKDYEVLKKRSLALPQNGSWAVFKHLDLLTHSVGLDLECTGWWVKGRAFGGKQLVIDWVHGISPETRLGKTFPEDNKAIRLIEDFEDKWTKKFQREIDPCVTSDYSETMACNYHSFYMGHYYVGHDIDKMLEEDTKYHKPSSVILSYLRNSCFERKFLGEHSGWDGVRKHKKGILLP